MDIFAEALLNKHGYFQANDEEKLKYMVGHTKRSLYGVEHVEDEYKIFKDTLPFFTKRSFKRTNHFYDVEITLRNILDIMDRGIEENKEELMNQINKFLLYLEKDNGSAFIIEFDHRELFEFTIELVKKQIGVLEQTFKLVKCQISGLEELSKLLERM